MLRAAFGHFQRAIEIEPEWAVPRGGLACGYRLFAGLGGPDAQAEYYPKAKATALRALELDDTVARAHIVLGLTLAFHEWKWAEAERAFLRGYELYPNVVDWPFAALLTRAGRYDEAIAHYRRALERYPTSPLIPRQLGEAYLCASRPMEAEVQARRVIDAFPDSFHGYNLLGLTFLRTSRHEEAVTLLEDVRGEAVAWRSSVAAQELPLALAKAGRVEEAQEMLRELEKSGADWFPELYTASSIASRSNESSVLAWKSCSVTCTAPAPRFAARWALAWSTSTRRIVRAAMLRKWVRSCQSSFRSTSRA